MRWLKNWNTATQLGLLMSAVVVLTALAIGWSTFQRLNADIVQSELDELQQESRTAAVRFKWQLNKLTADTLFLAQTPPPTGYARALSNGGIDPQDGTSTPVVWMTRLAIIFQQFMQANPEYIQIRYIAREPHGQELLRVDRRDDRIVRVPDDQLQEKGDRYYFREALQVVAPGQVYVSRLDLNREFGEITTPMTPVLRTVAPVYTSDNEQVYGVIVINLDADFYFNVVERELRNARNLFVINGNGDFLVHPDSSRRFASELGGTYRLADQWPELTGLSESQQIPLSFVSRNYDGVKFAVGAAPLDYDMQNPGAELLFVLAGDQDLVSPQLSAMRRQIIWTSLVLLAIALAASILLAKAFTRRLRVLAQSAKSMAAGNYDIPLANAGRDEVSELAVAMTRMAAGIKDKISRLHDTEERLRDNANFLESIFEQVPAMVFVKDAADLRFVRFNRAAERITGFSEQEMIGKNDFDFFPDDEARRFTDADRKILQRDRVAVIGDETITCKDGSQRILHTRKVAIPGSSGEAAYLLGVSQDVTERRKAEQALEYSERRFRTIVDTAADGIITITEDGTVLTFNPAACGLFGYAAKDLIGKNVRTLMPEPDRSRHDTYLSNYRETGEAKIIGSGRDVIGLRGDGSTFPLRLSVAEASAADRRTFTGIIHDLTREKEDERHLIEARQQAEDANRAKSDFLATMSHELRTPLNAIIGYSEMLAEDAESAEGLTNPAEDLHKIRNAGRHLLGLINDVLDLSKIEAGSADLEVTRFSITGLAREVAETVRQMIENKGNALELSIDDTADEVQTDPTRLRQILLNLLSNAAKFTVNGSVRLSLRIETPETAGDRQIVVQVRDSGIGIEAKNLERIFEAFSQADASTTREYGGTGLGLAITRSTCALMGGDIDVSSEPGQGTEFTVRLPADLPMRQTAADLRRVPDAAEVPQSSGSNVVLVIEDDESSRRLMVQQLNKLGWQAAEASSGIDGLKKARELRPCAIILDVMMPELDGWAVLQILKDDAQLSHIPVVLCTIVDEKQRGFALGAADYLLKPVSRRRLKDTLSKFCVNPPCNLLIVEDDDSTRDLFSRSARGLGWQVAEAGDGREALEHVRALRPDLILLDLMMPQLDGFGVVDALQREKAWQDIPVVVVTAKDLTDEDRRKLNGYVETVVSKNERDVNRLIDYVIETLGRIVNTKK